MDLETRVEIPAGLDRATLGLLNSEAAKLLARVGEKLIKREKLFLKHWERGQGAWKENDPVYAKRKRKRWGSGGKFLASGRAKRALAGGGAPLFVRANGRKRRLTIGLRRMVGGVNVYQVAQAGRFRGVRLRDGGGKELALNAAETFAFNRRRKRASKGGGLAGRLKTVARIGDKEMLITAVLDGDEGVVEKVLREELGITMARRGF